MTTVSTFTDQVVWITGASSGIGAALARAFAAAGARVVLSARREAELHAVAKTLAGDPARHLVLPLDLAQPDTFATAVETVTSRVGPVDLLVNNGGIGQRGLAAQTPVKVDRRIMEVNYFGQVALSKAVLPGMLTRRAGRIVVMSSVVGYVATPNRSAYAASKHALHGFFNALRAEVHAQGVRVSVVCPGYVRTEISLHALDSTGERHAKMDKNQAQGMSAEDFARRLLPKLAAGRDEIHLGGLETYAVWLQRFLPAITARVLRRRPS